MRFVFFLIATLGVALFTADAMAGERCVMVVPRQGNEALVNTCNECRMVQVSRSRSGGSMRGKRNYAVPARTKVDLTFNSAGKTRIYSDLPCRKSNNTQKTQSRRDDKASECIKIAMLKIGKPALINSCPACRKVTLEYSIKNVGLRSEVTKVNPMGVAVLTPHPDAQDVHIRSEKSCGIHR